MTTVSVIMPAFNAGAYLHTAVESVLRQTFADLELLIVDDGSSDDTVAAATRLASSDARVRVLTQPNLGPGPARNTGFRAATGRYFAFLDSDDEWDPMFLEAQLAILNSRSDVHVVFGNAWNRGGARAGQPSRPIRGAGQPISLAEILADERALFIMAVFRREVIDAVHGFDPALFTNEEYELWIRAAIAGFAFTRNPQPLAWYTCRPGSLSSSDVRMLAGILRVFEKTRPTLPAASPERAILDRQVVRFKGELAAVQARASLAQGNRAAAARYLSELHAHRGGWLLGLAARLPSAAIAAYRLREAIVRHSAARVTCALISPPEAGPGAARLA